MTDTHRWTHDTDLVRHDTNERIVKGQTFSPSDHELRAWPDRIEETDGDSDLDDSDAGAWLQDLEGVGEQKADDLEDAGYAERERIESASVEDLEAVDGVSRALAESIKSQLGEDEP